MAESRGTSKRDRVSSNARGSSLSSSGSPPSSSSGDGPRRLDEDAARAAWGWVDATSNQDTRFATLARKLPSYLQVSGLGQTMAFLYSKSSDASSEGRLFERLAVYLYGTLPKNDAGALKNRRDLMNWLVALSPDDYRQASRAARVVSEWLKRFAEGKFGVVVDSD